MPVKGDNFHHYFFVAASLFNTEYFSHYLKYLGQYFVDIQLKDFPSGMMYKI